MATAKEWAEGYARQANADFKSFEVFQNLEIPECHKLQFLQMACEKLVKAHLCDEGTDPLKLQTSHAYIANTLPIVLRQQAVFVKFTGAAAKKVIRHAKHLAQEIHYLAPAVKRGGTRLDNCEYPWVDERDMLHVPLDWSFSPSQLLFAPAGRSFLKLVHGAINRHLNSKSHW